MAGKVPNLSPWQGITRVKGVLHQYYSPFYQRWITRSWPKGQGADSAGRQLARWTFEQVVQGIKSVEPGEREAALEWSANTPYLERDLLMKAATGTLIQFTDEEGRFWMSTRIAIQAIQPMLDSISNTPGSMLVRNGNFWDFVPPPASRKVLLYNTTSHLPEWNDPIVLTQELLDAISTDIGTLLVRDNDNWIAFAPGAAGSYLQTLGVGELPQWAAIPPPGPSPGDDVIAAYTAVPPLPGFDPNFIGTAGTFNATNTTWTPASGSPYNYFYGTTARYSGKWYHEIKCANTAFYTHGYSNLSARYIDTGGGSPGNFGLRCRGHFGWQPAGAIVAGGGVVETAAITVATIQAYAAGNVLGCALDIDNRLVWFRTGTGNWNNSGTANPATGVGGVSAKYLFAGSPTTMVVPAGNCGNTGTNTLNLKSVNMVNGPPSGFSPWAGI